MKKINILICTILISIAASSSAFAVEYTGAAYWGKTTAYYVNPEVQGGVPRPTVFTKGTAADILSQYNGGIRPANAGYTLFQKTHCTQFTESGSCAVYLEWHWAYQRTIDCQIGLIPAPDYYSCIPPQPVASNYLNSPDFTPTSPKEANSCPTDKTNNPAPTTLAGNPIDTLNGNKTRIENDYQSSGLSPLSFTRYYSSNKNKNTGLGFNWRHSYTASLKANIHVKEAPYVPNDSNFSTLNSTPKIACETGWNDIKTTYGDPALSSSTAVYVNNNCSIQDNISGVVLGNIAVRDTSIEGASPNPPSDTVVIERPNGNVMSFTLVNSVWTAPSDIDVSLTQSLNGFTLTTAQDEVEEYNTSGQLISITDRKGLQQALTYNATTGLLETVTDSFGKTLTFAYIGTQLNSVTLPDSKQLIYGYDTANNLSSVKREDLSVKTYVYEDVRFPNAITGIIDELGQRYMTFSYDTLGRAETSELGDGVLFSAEKVTVAYINDSSSTVTDALGQLRTYRFTPINGEKKLTDIEGAPCTSCGGLSTHNTYDAYGYVNSKTDFNGVVTSFINNARGLPLTRTEALATKDERLTTYQWHAEYALPTCIIETARTTHFTYLPKGLLETRTTIDTSDVLKFATPTSKTCDAIVARTDFATLNKRTTTNTYYPDYGLLQSIDGPRTDVSDLTTFTYDLEGQLSTITNSLNQVTQLKNYNLRGQPRTLIDANGLTTTISYDARGQIDLVTVNSLVTDYDFDAVGQLDKVTQADGSFIDYDYDVAHRLTDLTDQAGNHIHYALDGLGNRTGTDVKDSSGTLKRTSTAIYNQLGLLKQSLGAATPAQTTDYLEYDGNGNLKTVRDPESNVTKYTYDALNRLETSTNMNLDTSTTVYDAHNRVLSVSDLRGLSTTYVYDGLGNRTQQDSPDTGLTQYTAFDGAGNVLSVIDAKNQITTYTYDTLNRIDLVTYDDGSTADYLYDIGVNAIGRLSRVNYINSTATNTGSTAWMYDLYGRVKSKTETVNSVALATTYNYNATTGQLDNMITSGGHTVAYSYLNAQLSRITLDEQTILRDIKYDPFGAANAWTWGNGDAASRIYDQDGQLDTYTLGNKTYDINYTLSGNIETIADLTTPANDQSFNYDGLHRLKDYSGSMGSEVYDYDANSNRIGLTDSLTAQTSSYVIDLVSNKLNSITGLSNVTYEYNANGNITNDGVHTFDYDTRNRLVAIDGSQARYQLNALGQRVRKEAAGNITLFHYNEQGQLVAEADSHGMVSKEYIYFNNMPVAVLSTHSVMQPVDNIIDNTDAGVLLLGNWKNSTSVAGFEGPNYSYHAANGMPVSSIIVDNSSADFSATGTWTASTLVAGFEGANYQHHFANGASPDAVVTDNASGSAVGAWVNSTSVVGFEGADYQHHAAGTGLNTFTWSAGVATTGDYNVYAKWTGGANRASNATYTVQHTLGNSPVTVNQQLRSGQWILLGQFSLDSSSEVSLSDHANGYVIADGIMVAPLDARPNTATWSIAPTTAGMHMVYAKWTAGANRASNARYTIHHVDGVTVVPQNQQTNGSQWVALGDFNLDVNSNVTLTDIADGYVIADAVAITPQGAAPNQAIWQLNVPVQANYDVFAKWTAGANRASDAPFSVSHVNGDTVLAVNQQVSGSQWNLLGNFELNSTSTVSLTDIANGYVIADALRVVGNTMVNIETLNYIHTDHLGTPRVLTDVNNNTVWSWHSDPFGTTAANEDPDNNGINVTFNLRFAGQYYDVETGLHYNYFRDYDPSTGRYVQSDPIGLSGGLNTYGYVGGNPLGYVDPTGTTQANALRYFGQEIVYTAAVYTFRKIGLTPYLIAGGAGLANLVHDINSYLNESADDNVKIGPWPGSTTADNPAAAGEEAADEIEEGKLCPPGANNPDKCKEVIRQCKQKCINKSEPGQTNNTYNWIQQCTNACTSALGCGNFGY